MMMRRNVIRRSHAGSETILTAQAGDLEVVDHDDIDRGAIIQEMDDARATLRRLLASADPGTLRRRSNGSRWTNEELLFHMVFGYMIVRALLILVRILGRLPAPVSRLFAAVLNFATAPFHVVNYWGVKVCRADVQPSADGGPVRSGCRIPATAFARENPRSLARSMSFPTRWDPFFTPTMTLAEVYHYPTQHFDFHRQHLSGPLAPTD